MSPLDLVATPYAPLYQHRPTVVGARGAVASASPVAAAAGLQVLAQGGNAVDAAVCVAAVECVTLPMLCGLGGEAFAVAHAPGRPIRALGSSGVAPLAVSADDFRRRGLTLMPFTGAESAAVPGEMAAFTTLLAAYGSMPLADVLAPAIAYADEGFVVSQRVARHLAAAAPLLTQFPTSARAFLPHGRPPTEGELLRQPDLARSLRLVAEGGDAAFYRGELADAMLAALTAGGSRYTRQEFAEHRAELTAPLRVRYRDHDVFVTALPSHGAIVAEALGLLDGVDLSAGPLAAPTLHRQIEAVRLAFADRLAYLGDPRFVAAPVDQLLSASYLAARRRAIAFDQAGTAHPGALDPQSSTTAFVVADSDGMAVSFIHSLSALGGSGLVAGDTGILLNNRIGRGFTLDAGHPNELAGGKRTMHTLNSYQIHRDGELVFLGATPGGDGQPQWNVQIICDLLDFGMGVQQAVEWPRWAFTPGTDPITMATPYRLDVDGRYPPEIVATLRAMGHPAHAVAPWEPGLYTSGVQLIQRRDGVYFAGSDPRAGGLAVAR